MIPTAAGSTKLPLIFKYPPMTELTKITNITGDNILVKFVASLSESPLRSGEKINDNGLENIMINIVDIAPYTNNIFIRFEVKLLA